MAQGYTPIWDDWLEVTQELNAQEKGRLIDAIVAYKLHGDWQEQIKGNERYVFPGYRVRIDRWIEISNIRGNAGSKQNGTNENKTEQNESKGNKTKQNAEVKDKVYEEDIKENTPKGVQKKTASRFSPPTPDEVNEYCKERNNGVDGNHFVDYYASKGWKIGNSPMKDWKAAVRTWEQRDNYSVHQGGGQRTQEVKKVHAQDYTQRTYTEADLSAVSEALIQEALADSD